MSSSACPAAAPAVTSLRPSRLATRVAGAAVGSPGTAIPASGAGPLLADAALMPSVPNAAAAARPAPIPAARRRLVLLIMLIVLPGICGRCLLARPRGLVRRAAGRRPTRNCGKTHSQRGEPNQGRIRGLPRSSRRSCPAAGGRYRGPVVWPGRPSDVKLASSHLPGKREGRTIPMEDAVNASIAGSSGQIVIAGAGYAGLHVAL